MASLVETYDSYVSTDIALEHTYKFAVTIAKNVKIKPPPQNGGGLFLGWRAEVGCANARRAVS